MAGAAQVELDEQELREREALLSRRHKSVALAYLAGGVAHDLNNLLTVIVGAADLLGENSGVEGERRAELLAIQRASERAGEITRQLLAYSRREPSLPLAFDLGGAVGELGPILGRLLGPRIRLELSFAPGLWPVWVDPLHAEHVVTHLALNARQAMPHGGVARLELSNVHVGRFERRGAIMVGPGDYVELCVRDTGVGMTEASIARAFEPFFAASAEPASTDLGLPLVRSLVARALGHIWIESEPARGTVFHVLFPRHGAGRASCSSPLEPVALPSALHPRPAGAEPGESAGRGKNGENAAARARTRLRR